MSDFEKRWDRSSEAQAVVRGSRNGFWTPMESRLQEQLPATLIRLETAATSGTVSVISPDSSTTDPEVRISRAESNEPNHRSMSQSRTFRVLVVAPGANPAVVYDALTAVATIDRRCVDEVHVLT